MAEDDLLHRLQQKLHGQTPSTDQIVNIRTQIAQHVEDLDAGPIPPYVQGLRRQLLQASQANREAKERLRISKIRDVAVKRTLPEDTILASQLNLLELRRQHQRCESISYHAAQLEDLAEQNLLLRIEPLHDMSDSDQSPHLDSPETSQVSDLITALETAVLKANYQLQRERQLLGQLRSESGQVGYSTSHKLNALETTRAELTNWIESNLARCDLSTPDSNQQPPAEQEGDLSGKDVDLTYQQYCQARSRLLCAVSTLSQPLPPIVNPGPVPPHVPHPTVKSMLPTIETRYLTLWKESNITRQHSAYISEAIATDNEQLTERLNRLRDESHLLPAYPLLKASTVAKNDSRSDHAHMLEAWKFANEAAQITTSEAIIKQSSEGHEATSLATETLQTMKLQSSLWHQVDGGQS